MRNAVCVHSAARGGRVLPGKRHSWEIRKLKGISEKLVSVFGIRKSEPVERCLAAGNQNNRRCARWTGGP